VTRQCLIEGCNRVVLARSWCGRHYQRWHQTGNPLGRGRPKRASLCAVEGCTREHWARGVCQMHYSRWRRTGSTDPWPRGIRRRPGQGPTVKRTPQEEFAARIVVLPNGCWKWIGHVTEKGYARSKLGGDRPLRVHKWRWEQDHGPVPQGLELDHLCHTNDLGCPGGNTCPHRRCVNPDHLEPVTPSENARRGRRPGGKQAPQTHCKYGHEFTSENTYLHPTDRTRKCRACGRERARARSAIAIAGLVPLPSK
jgi:hypothetical protein